MNVPASPCKAWLPILFLIAWNAPCIASQSASSSNDSQKATTPSPTPAPAPDNQTAPAPDKKTAAIHKQAAAPAPENSAKPAQALSLRERSWGILHAGLEIDNTDKRVKAVTALGIMKGNAEAEKLAIAALKDPKGDVRAAAANALGTMHALRAKASLEGALDDNEPAVVLAAANSLILLKDSNFAYDIYYGVLTGTMRTNNGLVREQIKEQLKVLHDKKKIAQLGLEQGIGFIPYGGIGYGMVKTFAKSDNSPIRAAAAKKLAHDPDPETAKALIAATTDKNWMVRAAALEAIAERGDRSLIPKVAPTLDDDKDEVRYAGAACIARLSALPAKHRVPDGAVASAAAATN
jgi:HEAT repeat protein